MTPLLLRRDPLFRLPAAPAGYTQSLKRELSSLHEAIDCLRLGTHPSRLLSGDHAEMVGDDHAEVIRLAWRHARDVVRARHHQFKPRGVEAAPADASTDDSGGTANRAMRAAEGGRVQGLDHWSFERFVEPLAIHACLAAPFELLVNDVAAPDELRSPEGRRAFLSALSEHGSKETVRGLLHA